MRESEKKFFAWIGENLKKADIKTPLQLYLQNAFKYSVLISIFFWLLWSLLFEDIFTGFFATLGFFALLLGLWAYYPVLKKKRKADLIDKELPFGLLNLSIEIGIENRFERALKNVCEKNRNFFGREIEVALLEISEGGVSVQEALINICARVESEPLKRAVMRIITIYEQGGSRKTKSTAIRSIAKEELSVQKSKSKEFSQKLVLYSVLFIVVSAVFPALFQAFIIVGSSFMKLDFSALQVIIIITIVFPLFDIGALLFIKSRTPQFLR